MWIATGYGAGAYLTDSVTGRIIREAVLPRFKAGDMGGGIIAGAERVIEVMKLPPEEAVKQAQQTAAQDKKRGHSGAGFIPVIFMGVIFFMLMIGRISRAGGVGSRDARNERRLRRQIFQHEYWLYESDESRGQRCTLRLSPCRRGPRSPSYS